MKQDAFPKPLDSILVPDLGTGTGPVQFVTWLVPRGAHVIPGERLAELLVSGVVLQLDSPQEGQLVEQCAQPGQHLQTGDVLAKIRKNHSMPIE